MAVDILDQNNEKCFEKGSSCRRKEEIPGTLEQLKFKELLFLQLQSKRGGWIVWVFFFTSVGIY